MSIPPFCGSSYSSQITIQGKDGRAIICPHVNSDDVELSAQDPDSSQGTTSGSNFPPLQKFGH